MSAVHVSLGERSYDVHVAEGVLEASGALIAEVTKARTAAIVTNPRIGKLYAERVLKSLEGAGIAAHVVTIPAGERYKTLNTVRGVYEKMLDYRIDRTSMVIGLGGGVVGDLAGFVAATYLRGVDFVQMPTSLLAQVDASVGGKVGVDLPRSKNLVGAFYQPKVVLADTGTLRTLPKAQFRSGLAEVIKHGIILDSEYYAYLERNLDAVMRLESGPLQHIVRRSVEIKASVVAQDERESGLRAKLNYGHTVGHAIESLTGYSRVLHGEAVAIGMVSAALISHEMGAADESLAGRIADLLVRAKLPYKPPKDVSPEGIVGAMKLDKKVAHGKLRFVLVREIGSSFVTEDVTPELIVRSLGIQQKLQG